MTDTEFGCQFCWRTFDEFETAEKHIKTSKIPWVDHPSEAVVILPPD